MKGGWEYDKENLRCWYSLHVETFALFTNIRMRRTYSFNNMPTLGRNQLFLTPYHEIFKADILHSGPLFSQYYFIFEASSSTVRFVFLFSYFSYYIYPVSHAFYMSFPISYRLI